MLLWLYHRLERQVHKNIHDCLDSFTISPPLSPMQQTTQLSLMTPSETDKLMKQANDCAEGECSLDEVADLIEILQGQQKELYKRVEELKSMIASLDHINEKDDRKVDEIRETVRAIWRVFQLGDKASGNDYPKLSRPTGWSGDVGDGPKTAYDVLPPKKYKASP
jgi:hypothetical protein